MMTMLLVAQYTQNYKPAQQLGGTPTLVAALLACIVLAALLILAVVLLSRPRRGRTRQRPRGVHNGMSANTVWRERIGSIVDRYEAGDVTRDEAFSLLAETARDFATASSGRDMSAHTLYDLSIEPRHRLNKRGLDLLRQTIRALYPAEFADERHNESARRTTVQQAAEWVSTLVERWR